jgi:predicted nucleic acid-binding Zn ribbon protein
MPTYVYETIPASKGEESRRYEFKQSIKDPAFVKHPQTGEPIKRIIAGSVSVLTSVQGGHMHTHTPSCGCGAGGCRG